MHPIPGTYLVDGSNKCHCYVNKIPLRIRQSDDTNVVIPCQLTIRVSWQPDRQSVIQGFVTASPNRRLCLVERIRDYFEER